MKGVSNLSQPNIPNNNPCISLTKNDAANVWIFSIAMEELGLAHLINAESEKIQLALDMLNSDKQASLEDILTINDSVQETLELVIKEQQFS